MVKSGTMLSKQFLILVAPMVCATAIFAHPANQVSWASAYAREDAKLNASYRRLSLMIGEASRNRLIMSQRAWIKFRDTECDYELSFPHSRKDEADFRYQCLIAVTSDRITQLNNQIQCPGVEGDVSCK